MLRPVVGLFVGGRGRRMGGIDKSTLPTPDGSILERMVALVAGLGLPLVLVGEGGAADSGLPRLADDPPGIGPLGGLCALLAHAGHGHAIALACDMPHIATADLRALADHPSQAVVLAARSAEWEPLFARYDAPRARPIAAAIVAEGRRALVAVLERAGAEAFTPAHPRSLIDWDTPEDRAR